MKIVIDVLEEFMKKIASFLDRHRVLLVFLILALIVIIFLGVNSYLFFHHDFLKLECTSEIDDEYCYYEDIVIFRDPEKSKEIFFAQYESVMADLQEEYHLADFNYYTAYYYLVVARLNYDINSEYKILEEFFQNYVNTYQLEDFYFQYNFYFNLFYRYKIN